MKHSQISCVRVPYWFIFLVLLCLGEPFQYPTVVLAVRVRLGVGHVANAGSLKASDSAARSHHERTQKGQYIFKHIYHSPLASRGGRTLKKHSKSGPRFTQLIENGFVGDSEISAAPVLNLHVEVQEFPTTPAADAETLNELHQQLEDLHQHEESNFLQDAARLEQQKSLLNAFADSAQRSVATLLENEVLSTTK